MQTAGANTMVLAISALMPAIIDAIGFVTTILCKMEKEIREMEAAQQVHVAE